MNRLSERTTLSLTARQIEKVVPAAGGRATTPLEVPARPAERSRRAQKRGAQRSAAAAQHLRAEGKGGCRPALGNTVLIFPVSNESKKTAKSRRSERYSLRDGLAEISSIESVRKCGRVPVAPLVSLRAKTDGKGAGYGGLHTCGSVWACPVCSAKIAARRKTDLQQVVDHAVKHGMTVSMLTLTQRHHNGQGLKKLWNALSTAWNRVTSGRRWIEFKEQLGLVGYVRANEVTHGKHGWHVHSHVLIISEKDPLTSTFVYQRKQGRRRLPYPPEVYTASEFIADRWEAGLAKHGVDFLRDSGGLDWTVAKDARAIGNYVSKMQTSTDAISSEVTLGGFKKARGGNRTPFQILADILALGDVDDLRLWHEYEKASFGRRALTWSKGLRDWANLGVEQSDEEIAAEEIGDEALALFTHDAWREVRRFGAAELLDVTESGGREAAYQWLDSREIDWQLPPKIE